MSYGSGGNPFNTATSRGSGGRGTDKSSYSYYQRGGGESEGSGGGGGGGRGSGSGGGWGFSNKKQSPPSAASILRDTIAKNYEAQATASNVMYNMNGQRDQLEGARGNVLEIKEMTKLAKAELEELRRKATWRRRKLYVIIGVLSITDMFLFYRLAKCGGYFWCDGE
ncbi:hypothetical protein TrLO_g2863 [Triparma laevis f. longispina]|uniref:Uncharacterized protein n=1 Tax=Triparma laevis f. longispina TaxID=1714387 RepID=A0A9W7CFW0_9STRA|nr:hypothetical protein TrLO_g2863 [Triparma laevis f. longispina]